MVMRSTRSPAGWARRAQVLLLLAEGLSVRKVEARTGMSLRGVVLESVYPTIAI
jgi:transposase